VTPAYKHLNDTAWKPISDAIHRRENRWPTCSDPALLAGLRHKLDSIVEGATQADSKGDCWRVPPEKLALVKELRDTLSRVLGNDVIEVLQYGHTAPERAPMGDADDLARRLKSCCDWTLDICLTHPGRRPQPGTAELVADLAEVYRVYTGRRPAYSPDGPFVRFATAVLNACPGTQAAQDYRRPIQAGLALYRERLTM
jgi:hypothetical protein